MCLSVIKAQILTIKNIPLCTQSSVNADTAPNERSDYVLTILTYEKGEEFRWGYWGDQICDVRWTHCIDSKLGCPFKWVLGWRLITWQLYVNRCALYHQPYCGASILWCETCIWYYSQVTILEKLTFLPGMVAPKKLQHASNRREITFNVIISSG